MIESTPSAAASRGLFVGYLGLLVWSPIPLGSNRPWSWGLLELWVFLLAAWWIIGFVRGKHHGNAVLKSALPALIVCAVWLAFVWLQLLPLPIELLKLLSPEAARWHVAAHDGPLAFAPLTVDRHGTLHGALKSVAYVLFFALSLALLDRRKRIAAAAYTVIVAGFLQAMFGGLMALGSESAAVAQGTFGNRNHFAGYLELCLSVGLGILISSLTGESSQTLKQFVRNTLSWILSPKMCLRLALAIMVIALVLSRSRMGNSAFFVSMLVTGGIGLLLSRRATRSMVLLLVTLVVIDICIVGAYFGVEKVVQRMEQTQLANERNESVQAVGVWKDYPVFGAGLGSFHVVFPKYSGAGLTVRYTHAHNDYVQFGCETGIIGLGLLGLLVAMSFVAALRAQYLRQDPLMRGISFGAVMGIIALMMHSTVDFNLQIPANALLFMLVLAFGWIALYHDRRRHHESAQSAINND